LIINKLTFLFLKKFDKISQKMPQNLQKSISQMAYKRQKGVIEISALNKITFRELSPLNDSVNTFSNGVKLARARGRWA
jgi:hypothetical protein